MTKKVSDTFLPPCDTLAMTAFFQAPPELSNSYDSDALLRSYVRRTFPPEIFAGLDNDYRRLGHRAVTDILELARAAEASPPTHIPYDPWGKRIDKIAVSDAWTKLDRIAAEEGIVATAYERKNGALSRIDQFIRLYLFHPSSSIYSCPLAMTDGAARLLEVYGDTSLKNGALKHLTSRDPETFWTSGQWMTERTGGSDVSGTSTIAKPVAPAGSPADGPNSGPAGDKEYRLSGTKWFTSATTSQMAMTLARIEGAPEGSAGLSLFYIETRDQDGNLRNIRVNRLKEKLGTRALPTAELTLEGTPAKLIGSPGDGVKKISTLFNVTRIYNACCSVGFMRRGLALARDYAHKRHAFGRTLSEHPLHLETIASLEIEFEAAFHLLFHVVALLGKEELGQATADEKAILRLLTPIAKLYTAKQSIAVASEVLESFGGAGYVEDTGIPSLLRDSQVLAIWEGTTNVLSLDTLRAIEREKSLAPFIADTRRRIQEVQHSELDATTQTISSALSRIEAYAARAATESPEFSNAGARGFSYSIARVAMATLMLEHAVWSLEHEKSDRALHAVRRWCLQDLTPLVYADPEHLRATRTLALD
jgi:alkylation response protein AidB-like acyl-CoA dehydrogenase